MIQGVYQYWLNGVLADVRETFRIELSAGLPTVITAERNSPTFSSYIAVNARYKQGKLNYFDVAWQNESQNAVRVAVATYHFQQNHVSVTRRLDVVSFQEEIPLPKEYSVLPLLRVFAGKAIRDTVNRSLPVFVPNIQNPADKQNLLQLEPDIRLASHLSEENYLLNGVEHPVSKYHFMSNQYDQSAIFWVGNYDLLFKYEWRQTQDAFWQVQLIKLEENLE